MQVEVGSGKSGLGHVETIFKGFQLAVWSRRCINGLEIFRVVNVHITWFDTYNFPFVACEKGRRWCGCELVVPYLSCDLACKITAPAGNEVVIGLINIALLLPTLGWVHLRVD